MGPKVTEWHLLPFGGVTDLELDPKDTIISAPPKPHQALLNDPNINSIKKSINCSINIAAIVDRIIRYSDSSWNQRKFLALAVRI